MATNSKLWFPYGTGAVLAEHQLICLPFAGGGASFYVPWRRHLPNIAVAPVQYPGRETRIEEACISNMEQLIEALALAILPMLDRPYSLLGYSLGAKVGFGLCHRLLDLGAPPPLAFLPMAHGAPNGEPYARGAADLPIEAFRKLLEVYGGMSDILFKDPEMMTTFLPILRTDLRLVEFQVPGQPIPSQIVAYGGDADPTALPDRIEEWQQYSTTGFKKRIFSGGHFFARGTSDFFTKLALDLDDCS
jgi:medium-chain acyl-[acyl-carrier-protein] hydrolase